MSSYGLLSPEMIEALRPHLSGAHVTDLMCGTMALSKVLVEEAGAVTVHGVDKERGGVQAPERCYTFTQGYLRDLPDIVPLGGIVFLSWPPNCYVSGLVLALERASLVVYLGANFGGTVCGDETLFSYFLHRKLLGYYEHPKNNMIIMGKELSLGERRAPTWEEEIALKGDLVHSHRKEVLERWAG